MTVDATIAKLMRNYRNQGSSRRYLHEEVGWNCRMDAIQAAVLRVKLKYIETWNEQRRARAATYHRLFAEAGLGGAGAPLTLPRTAESAHHVLHQYVILALTRAELAA